MHNQTMIAHDIRGEDMCTTKLYTPGSMHKETTRWCPNFYYYHRGLSIQHKINIYPSKLPCVMLTFVTTHLYPMWKLHLANENLIK